MKKILGKTFALLIVPTLAFSQTAESFSDNNIEYPSFEMSNDFNPGDYSLETLDIEDLETSLQEIDTVPFVEDILPNVNPAESLVLTSSSGNGLDAYKDKDLQVPSRSITIAQNQYVDVEYPGKGWLYLGETDNTTFLRYFGHTLTSNTVFTLRAKSQGKAILHFYKIDSLTGDAINDYLEVVISGKTNSDEHLLAPSYSEIVPKGQGKKPSMQEIDTEVLEIVDDSIADSKEEDSAAEEIQDNNNNNMEDSAIAQDYPEPKTEAIAQTPKKEPTVGSEKNNSASSSSTAQKNNSSSGASSSRPNISSNASRPSTGNTGNNNSTASSSSASDNRTTTSVDSSNTLGNIADGSNGYSSANSSSVNTGSSTDTSPKANNPSSSGSTKVDVPKPSSSKKQVITSAADDELLAKAQKLYNSKNYAECLDTLTEFFNNAITRIDEGLFLQGQALEANSTSRNIKAALDTYETLVKRYPQSKKWKAANERVIYIKRFYFNIR